LFFLNCSGQSEQPLFQAPDQHRQRLKFLICIRVNIFLISCLKVYASPYYFFRIPRIINFDKCPATETAVVIDGPDPQGAGGASGGCFCACTSCSRMDSTPLPIAA
jgi:hypothetical protein